MFSIICPIYNSSKYLRECIDSVLSQEFSNFELLLIDDGSSDNSLLICKAYEEQDNRIIVISQKNSGPYLARLNGMQKASNRYLLFLDSDDKLMPNCLETLYKAITNNDYPDLIAYNFSVDSNGTHSHKEEFTQRQILNSYDEILKYCFCYHTLGNLCRFCVKKEIIGFNTLKTDVQTRYAEDAYMVMQIIQESTTMVVLNDLLYFYRSVQSSLTNTVNQNSKFGRLEIFEKIINELKEKEVLSFISDKILNKYSWIATSYLLHSYKDSFSHYLDRLSYLRKTQLFKIITLSKKTDNKKANIAIFLARYNLRLILRMYTKIIKYYN